MDKDNKNTELDSTDKKLHISDVMCCFCGELHEKLENSDDIEPTFENICEDCYGNGFHNNDFKDWLIIERMVIK